MSLINQLSDLNKNRAALAQAEAKFAADRTAALAKLPSDFGYPSLAEFIKALTVASKGKKSKVAKGAKEAKAAKTDKAPKAGKKVKAVKGKRAKITPELKAEVKALAEAGKTGAEIAKAVGISLPSIQNIRKEFGMVKSRASKAAPEVVAVQAAAPEAAPVA